MPRKALSLSFYLPGLLPVARKAGDIIMQYYQGERVAERKEDDSPVTDADRAADAYIVSVLRSVLPAIPAVSEEGEKPDIAHADYFWLIDPLDGTRSFVRGSGYFTVNIGLIGPTRQPEAGIIYDPVHRALYWGWEGRAMRQLAGRTPERLHMREWPPEGPTAIVSHRNLDKKTEAFLTKNNIKNRIPCASSIKFCRLAEGAADIYPRFGPTMEWDVAAGHAILLAAGGTLTTPEGAPFLYGKPGFANGSFVAREN